MEGNYSQSFGKTTIAPDVLHAIARLTTLSVKGVYNLVPSSKTLDRWFSKPEHEGVKVHVQDDSVYTDIYVALFDDVNVRDVSREIQNRVSRAIAEMVGMDVGYVNIHVMDIVFQG